MAEKKKPLGQRILERLRPRRANVAENVVSLPVEQPEADTVISSIRTTRLKLHSIDLNNVEEKQLIDIYEEMDCDPIVSSALDFYADSSTQTNRLTGKTVYVKVEKNKELEDELNAFLQKEVDIDNVSWVWARNLMKYGKVILDTELIRKSGQWVFEEVEERHKVYPLAIGGNKIKYVLYRDTKNESDTKTSFFYSLDSEEKQEVLPANRFIVVFYNQTSVGNVDVATESTTGKSEVKTFKLQTGQSVLKSVIKDWQTLCSLEDTLFINRLTRSMQFTVVHIDTTGMTNKQSKQVIDSVKASFGQGQTLNANTGTYKVRQMPVPENSFVFIPTKEKKGSIEMTTIGGEIKNVALDDINHFRNKVFAGLGVAKSFSGFEEATAGGLGDNTITRLDENQGRKVKRVQSLLINLVEQIIEYYWVNSDLGRTKKNLPDFEIILGEINSSEREQAREEMEANLRVAREILGIINDQRFEGIVDNIKAFDYLMADILNINPDVLKKEPTDIVIDAQHIQTYLDSRENVQDREPTDLNDTGTSRPSITRPERPSFEAPTEDIEEAPEMETITVDQVVDNLKAEVKNYLLERDFYLERNNKKYLLENLLNTSNNNIRTYLNEKTYKDLKDMTQTRDPERVQKSKRSIARYIGLDNDNFINFEITAEDIPKNIREGKPTSYRVKIELKALVDLIKEFKEGRQIDLVRKAVEGDIRVSCECPAAKYWGMQWNGTRQDYSIVRNTIAPTKLEPKQQVCKHTYLALQVLPFWTNTILKDIRAKGLLNKEVKKQEEPKQEESKQEGPKEGDKK